MGHAWHDTSDWAMILRGERCSKKSKNRLNRENWKKNN
jgi:hypothetical protein